MSMHQRPTTFGLGTSSALDFFSHETHRFSLQLRVYITPPQLKAYPSLYPLIYFFIHVPPLFFVRILIFNHEPRQPICPKVALGMVRAFWNLEQQQQHILQDLIYCKSESERDLSPHRLLAFSAFFCVSCMPVILWEGRPNHARPC